MDSIEYRVPLSANEIRAAIVVADNGNAGGVNQIAATGATLQEGLLLSVTLASPIYSNGSLYLALNSGTAYQAICATVKGAGYRGVSTGEVEAGIPYLFQYSTVGGGRWILQSRSYLAPGDMPAVPQILAPSVLHSFTGGAAVQLEWGTATKNDFATYSAGAWTMTKSGLLRVTSILALTASRDFAQYPRVDTNVMGNFRATDNYSTLSFQRPVLVGQVFDIVAYNYGTTVAGYSAAGPLGYGFVSMSLEGN